MRPSRVAIVVSCSLIGAGGVMLPGAENLMVVTPVVGEVVYVRDDLSRERCRRRRSMSAAVRVGLCADLVSWRMVEKAAVNVGRE